MHAKVAAKAGHAQAQTRTHSTAQTAMSAGATRADAADAVDAADKAECGQGLMRVQSSGDFGFRVQRFGFRV